MRGSRMGTLLLGAGLGAAGMLLLDPRLGRRRRALLHDKAGHYARVMVRNFRRGVRSVPGPVRGAIHEAAERAPWHTEPEPPDRDQFIKERVESVLGRDPDIPAGRINIDAADAVVQVRGTVPDAETAERIVRRVAAVDGVRAVRSLMHTPDGTPVGGEAGDRDAIHGRPRAAVQAEDLRRRLREQWPGLTDADILASDGHLGRLTELICSRTGEPEERVRPALDRILLPAT